MFLLGAFLLVGLYCVSIVCAYYCCSAYCAIVNSANHSIDHLSPFSTLFYFTLLLWYYTITSTAYHTVIRYHIIAPHVHVTVYHIII